MRPALRPHMQSHATRAAPLAAPTDAIRMGEEWLRLDQNPETRAAVTALIESGSEATLRDLMCQRLEFGERP